MTKGETPGLAVGTVRDLTADKASGSGVRYS